MKLYLFGGCETDQGQAPTLKKQINDIISNLKPKQLLHVPYARTDIPEGEEDVWGDGWVKRDLDLDGIELLDARNVADLEKAEKPLVFMNGGGQNFNLYQHITQNKKLHELVRNADVIIGESAGAMIHGAYFRADKDGEVITTKGLGFLKDTIMEPHYSQRNRHQLLRDEVKELDVKYGVGVDSITAIVVDTETYPDEYETIGDGLVDFVRKEEL